MTGFGGVRRAKIVAEKEVLQDGTVLWQDGMIVYTGNADGVPHTLRQHAEAAEDADGDWILPGFIDLHIHGGFGGDFMDGTPESYDSILSHHTRHGTTGMLATTITSSRDDLECALTAIESYRHRGAPYAELHGVHLEGPFISPKWPGAQNPAWIVPPDTGWLEDWTGRFPGLIRMVTLAPEQPGGLEAVKWLVEHGIIASCGHTDATYDEIEAAADQGLSHAVHAFNAMRGLHHREPGTAGAVLTDPRLCAEVIADGLHVHPACIRLLVQMKNSHNLILITDAMSASGLGDGDYTLGGLEVTVRDGAARLKQGGALAGSTLTMMDAFRFAVGKAGVSIPEASSLASGNPARRLGVYNQVGSIATGKYADLLRITRDEELKLSKVWKKGALVSTRG